MRIIFSTDNIGRGGKERQLNLLFSLLPDNQFQKFILTKKFSADNNYLSEYKISSDNIRIYNDYNQYRKLIKEIIPEIVLSWDVKSSLYNLLLYKKYSYKFINGSIRHGIRTLRYSHILRTVILWFSPYVIANSCAGLKANNLKPGNTNYILYNGFDNSKTKFITGIEKNTIRKEIFSDIGENDIVFISVANFVPFKDYPTILKSFFELKNKIKFKYIIVGDGPLRSEIENDIRKKKLDKNVYLAGRVDDVFKYLQISDIYLHSSKGEGISNAILEAMFYGLPVICSNVGGVRETIYEPFSLLYRYKNKDELKSCLLKSSGLLMKFNREDEDYKKHLEKFSSENMVRSFLKIISTIK